jgi:hypothetical protein
VSAPRLRLALLLVAVLALPPLAAAAGGQDPSFGYGPYAKESRAVGFCAVYAKRKPRYRSCVVEKLLGVIVASNDPAVELPRIDRYVHSTGGYVELNCHILMHAAGRAFGREKHVTLESLLRYLPRSNDPGCSAGFAHGLLTYLGPQIVRLGPRGAAADCHRASTRYQRYSCIHGLGHAYARLFVDAVDPALASCKALGPDDAPDCAQGVFHDYWIAIAGLDGTKRPADGSPTTARDLCGEQDDAFVRACWYRALLERPPPAPVRTVDDMRSTCDGLDGLQHDGCMTAASLIASPDPYRQLALCAGLRGDDAAACVRGIRAPAVARTPLGYQVGLVRGCATVDPDARRRCYEWLGEALNVVTNGSFATRGCTRLRYPATRASCARGARSYQGALETFS